MPARLPGRRRRTRASSAPDARQAIEAMQAISDPQRALSSARFFKTGPGEYGAGDRFLGVAVPDVRRLARDWHALPLPQLSRLLASPWNEVRLLALLVMVRQFDGADAPQRERICRSYLRQRRRVNNWNLVDSSAPQILGEQLRTTVTLAAAMRVLRGLAASASLWDRRIAVVATQAFIRAGDLQPTLQLVPQLLSDHQDLMHKACGWMLREVGDRSRPALERFLQRYHRCMPRTMLRTAIEKLPPARRATWLAGADRLVRRAEK